MRRPLVFFRLPTGIPTRFKRHSVATDRLGEMIVTLYRNGDDGKTRYYTVHDRQQVLTSPWALTAAWRSGNGREREKLYTFETLAAMDAMIRRLLSRRIGAGYRLLYSWSRDARWSTSVDAGADASAAPPLEGLLARALAARKRA